jgi:LOC100145586 protein (fragment)
LVSKTKYKITPGIEKQETIGCYRKSRRVAKKEAKIEREKNAGKGWFNLPSKSDNPNLELDTMMIKYRNVWENKRFYKKREKQEAKFCQIGTVVDAPENYYADRVTRKARKATIVEELLQDKEFKDNLKKRFFNNKSQSTRYLNKRIK